MRIRYSGYLLCLALLMGCGGSHGFVAGPTQTNYIPTQRLAQGPKLYVSELEGDNFFEYRLPNTAPLCSKVQNTHYAIVNGIGTDASGTLWLPTLIFAGSRAGAYIFSYSPKCGAQGTTLYGPSNAQPVGIAFSPDGTKYGLMLLNGGYATSVAVYPTGATTPTAELTDPRLNGNFTAQGLGVDADGKVYVSCCGNTKPKHQKYLIVFKGGQGSRQSGKRIHLSQIQDPGASITFDRSRNMLITDINTSSLKIYAPPYGGKPTTFALQGNSPSCALSRRESLLVCADYDNQDVDVYAYPSVSYQYSLTYSNPSRIPPGGVAFANP